MVSDKTTLRLSESQELELETLVARMGHNRAEHLRSVIPQGELANAVVCYARQRRFTGPVGELLYRVFAERLEHKMARHPSLSLDLQLRVLTAGDAPGSPDYIEQVAVLYQKFVAAWEETPGFRIEAVDIGDQRHHICLGPLDSDKRRNELIAAMHELAG